MGYRGKLREREEARRLRAQGHTLLEIAERLGVSKSSVSLWVRDVAFEPRPRRRSQRGRRRAPNRLARRKQDAIDRLLAEGRERIGALSERDFLIAGVALEDRRGGQGSRVTYSCSRTHRTIMGMVHGLFEAALPEKEPVNPP